MQFQTLTLQHNCNGATAQNLQNNISEEHNHIVTNRQNNISEEHNHIVTNNISEEHNHIVTNLQNNISEEHNHIVTNRQFIWAIHVSVILS